MKLALASDHAAFRLRARLAARLREEAHEVLDLGCPSEESCDYPDFAAAAARAVADGRCARAIVACGTGIGVCMAANKIAGVRAALVHDRFTAQMSREHNDANVLCLGARVLSEETAVELARFWLTVEFAGGRHAGRVAKIAALDRSRR
ncbi:MAG: ribose 5-phosphate isomerase B [Planctomycetaceae bacterium]